jgi:ADP-ribose pyrophosphatase
MPVAPPPNAKKAWQGQIYTAWEWPQELFDGSTATFECVTRQDTTTVIAFPDPETILLTRQAQPGRPDFIDAPGGRVDPGEDHLTACRRELEEETGFQANDADWMPFEQRAHHGTARFEKSIFLARNARPTGHAHADAGERITLVPTPWDEAVAMSLAGALRQTDVMYAILRMHFDPKERERIMGWVRGA